MNSVPKSPAPLDAETSPEAAQSDARGPAVGATPAKLARFLDLLDAEFTKKSDGGGAEGV